MDNPSLLYALASHLVKITMARETFVVNQLGIETPYRHKLPIWIVVFLY